MQALGRNVRHRVTVLIHCHSFFIKNKKKKAVFLFSGVELGVHFLC